jgi:sec-independent protein translocase protein TatA
MGSMSLVHWIVVAIVVLLLFGRGRISETMGDFGKGLKSFRQGMAEDDRSEPTPAVKQVTDQSVLPPQAEQMPGPVRSDEVSDPGDGHRRGHEQQLGQQGPQ